MIALSPNPGFALLCGALFALILPAKLRPPGMVAAALGAIWLMFSPDFGEAVSLAQIGLVVTPLRLDALSQVFGLGFGLLTAMLALFSGYRRDKLEDVALMTLAGGAATAAFAGDLITFTASASLAGFAGVVLACSGRTPEALSAGLRMAGWQGLAAILLAAGAGLVWADQGSIDFDVMQTHTPGGALFFAALLILAAAPLAHAWLRDGATFANPVAGAALAALAPMIGVYGLLRAFGGEPLLVWIGMGMALWPLPYAALARDLRRALAYGVISQIGCVLIGIGAATFLAMSGAAAMAFALMLHAGLSFTAIGFAYRSAEAQPAGRNQIGGLARTMPVTALMAIIAGLSAVAAPGFAGFAGMSVIGAAVGQEGRALAWATLALAGAGAVFHAGLRAPYEVFFGRDNGARPADAPFAQQMAMGLAAFFCVAIGMSPGWLYGLLPEQILFHPYEGSGAFSRLQLIVFAAMAFVVAKTARLYPTVNGADIADIDWLYRTPGRALGAALVRASAWASVTSQRGADFLLARWRAWAQAGLAGADRPVRAQALAGVWLLAGAGAMLLLLYIFQA